MKISTRYQSHPGSNVGDVRATGSGLRRLVRCDQSIYQLDNHRRAAEKVAEALNVTIDDTVRPVARDGGGYIFQAN